jgi:2-methylisocitrate lyase-like PEP mutase family enzyme
VQVLEKYIEKARSRARQDAAPNLDDTIRRLQASEKVGADVLFAPGLPDLDAVPAVRATVSNPFNFMVGIQGKSFSNSPRPGSGASVWPRRYIERQ